MSRSPGPLLRRLRRPLLGCGAALMVLTGIEARAETEIETAGYAGSTTGAWTCGPTGRARYAGVGARARFSEQAPTTEQGSGWVGDIGAAAEMERVRLLNDDGGALDDPGDPGPPDALQTGAGLRVGRRWHSVGLEFGAMVFSGWKNPEHRDPSYAGFPQLELSFGSELTQWVFLGTGGATATTLRRPALGYAGLCKHFGDIHQIILSGGLYRAGPAIFEEVGPRGDLVWRMRVVHWLDLRAGVSISRGSDLGFDGEGSLGLVWVL